MDINNLSFLIFFHWYYRNFLCNFDEQRKKQMLKKKNLMKYWQLDCNTMAIFMAE